MESVVGNMLEGLWQLRGFSSIISVTPRNDIATQR